jgi:hypothetical protein
MVGDAARPDDVHESGNRCELKRPAVLGNRLAGGDPHDAENGAQLDIANTVGADGVVGAAADIGAIFLGELGHGVVIDAKDLGDLRLVLPAIGANVVETPGRSCGNKQRRGE